MGVNEPEIMDESVSDDPFDGEGIAWEAQKLFQDIVYDNIKDNALGPFLRSILDGWWTKDITRSPVALLPYLVCQMYGGSPANALPVMVAWRYLCLAAKLIDDVEDGEVTSSISEQITDRHQPSVCRSTGLGKTEPGKPSGSWA